jgi:cytoskeletal protein CcmA (bactofilin family)
MFGRKGADGVEETQDSTTTNEAPATVGRSAEAPQHASRAASPALARRVVEMPGRRTSAAITGDERKLTVGKGLSLAGEITSCDILVVEGKVEAKLTDGKLLEIAESGQFRGSVEIENADIAGRYDGQLIVHGRLTVRATGRISGMVKYGEIEVSAGGQIIGEMQVAGGGTQQEGNGKGTFKSAARFTSGEEAEAATASNKKSA